MSEWRLMLFNDMAMSRPQLQLTAMSKVITLYPDPGCHLGLSCIQGPCLGPGSRGSWELC